MAAETHCLLAMTFGISFKPVSGLNAVVNLFNSYSQNSSLLQEICLGDISIRVFGLPEICLSLWPDSLVSSDCHNQVITDWVG